MLAIVLKIALSLTVLPWACKCFIPAEIIDFIVGEAGNSDLLNFGRVSETLTHEDIMRRGITKSVAKFLADKNSSVKLRLGNMTDYYEDIRNLYYDYYGKWICDLKVESLIKTEFGPNVAAVDLLPSTKDLPYAHFDAETFVQSNLRVINFTNTINGHLASKSYSKARSLIGHIMHTVQDFYSHSNWIEMGNVQRINTLIGTTAFNTQSIATMADNVTCVSNCTLVESKCSFLLQLLVSFLEKINFHALSLKCPVPFYKCSGNLLTLDKLVSGFYSGQKLPDGSAYTKPTNGYKCSHGGMLDADSMKVQALGGINKDSGYYIFSPKADLHLIAAELAINHTEYYFNSLRTSLGDDEFDKLMQITLSRDELSAINDTYQVCGALKHHPALILITAMALIWFKFY